MSKTIRITLSRNTIIDAVKSETFHKGQADKAADGKAITLAYHEQAGDDAYQERLLSRALEANLGELVTYLSDFITDDETLTADNITQQTSGDTITMMLRVSDRFNGSYTDPLAKLFSEYIINAMLTQWWKTINEKQAALYASFMESNVMAIRRCFSKKAPKAPAYAYPTAINLLYPIIPESNGVPGSLSSSDEPADPEIPVEILFSNPWTIGVGQKSEITYTLTGENGVSPVDDIVIRADNPCCHIGIDNEGWYAKGIKSGYTIVTLFSRHNDRVYAKFAIHVTQ